MLLYVALVSLILVERNISFRRTVKFLFDLRRGNCWCDIALGGHSTTCNEIRAFFYSRGLYRG
jgi:hypothetical protein